MPRIDPLQLLNCLQVLLSPNGGILSKNEVHRLASLMTKFSKKLVSKCVYVLILKNTEVTLLGLFMAAGGWTLIHLWLHDAIYTMNWALVKELLELLLLTPVDVERLKSNNIPKLVKSLSKREDLQGVHDLSNQLVQQWLKIVKDETQYELASLQKTIQSAAVPEETNTDSAVQSDPGQTGEEDVVEYEEYDSGINSQTFYKLTLKDGKHLISKVGANETNFQVLENVEVVEMKDEEDVKDKEKKEDKKRSHDKSKHKSSSSSKTNSSSSSSRDKAKTSHRDKSKHSSSSKDKDRSRDKHKHDKSKDKDRHRSNGSVSKSNSKSSSSSSSSNSSFSSKDKEKDKEKKDTKEKQAEKDIDTLSKIQPHTLQKLPKIPKKSSDEKEKSKDAKKDDPKKGTISVEVRKNSEERPKTVKVYKSKMRSTGLEEEAKPAPPRPTKKPVVPVIIPPPPVPPLKRSSPVRDLNAVPPEKKPKLEAPLERPNSIKLIPPKPKPAVLQESDMFMDALTASATTKKEPKKRKRRASVSKDSTGTSPPSSPSSKETVASFKNLSPPKFYQDTLETEESKADSAEDPKATNTNEDANEESNSAMEVPDRVPTPTETTADEEEEEPPRTRNNNGLKGVLVYVRRKGPKKSIKWKADDELVDIQYFELDETERVNVTKTFGDLAKMDVRGEREALMSRKLPNEDVMDIHTLWRIPFEIDLPELLAEPGSKSLEKDIQFAREKSVLQAIYFNKKMLPETPAEPDPEMYQVKDPIVIPVDAADNPDHDFRDTPWPEPKASPPPQNMQNNVSALFPNVQGPFTNFPMAAAPNFQNMQNMPNVQPFQGPPFMQQNVMGGGDWNNVNMPPNMHNPQMMSRNMPPPEIMNQGIINPNMFIPPQENFNPMMNDNNHRFPPPFNQQGPGPGPGPGPGMFPNNFNRGGFRRGGGNGPWLRMNVPAPGNWNMRNGGGPHRGGARMCHHFRNKGFCKNRDNCMFFHPNN